METTPTEEKMGAAEAHMRAGIEIANERREQVEKHKFTAEHDDQYTNGELAKAAIFCVTLQGWPHGWRMETMNHIAMKPYRERLIIGAAFMKAEVERCMRAGIK